ncbi:hypothetical protein, conserved [Plasmodium gonderi]|uniref:Uncharacterized protein n=1 Tax=Plasmodium gonderi TaxID=77519 RepID=A0A1Y1JH51_PLAGO|nr:hypothetical protein, conserved [Plasmodium gonderi]GAW79763.1 hypothetical protein, conserved [Plasmodium gonderi]
MYNKLATMDNKKINYGKSYPTQKSPYMGFTDESAIRENPWVHESIKQKQLKIAELMLNKKTDNELKKNVNFSTTEKEEESKIKEDLDKKNLTSISNASIAEVLNKKLFGNNQSWKNKNVSYSHKNIDEEKVSILSKYKDSYGNKENSNTVNKLNESNKTDLNNFLLTKSTAYSSKDKFFIQKRLSDITKKGNSTDRITTLNSQKSNEKEYVSKRGKSSLMKGLSRSPTNADALDESCQNFGDESDFDLPEDSNNCQVGDIENVIHNSYLATNRGNTFKRGELKNSKNGPLTNKNSHSYEFFKSPHNSKSLPCDKKKRKDKNRKVNFFFNFLNFKKKCNKRKNDKKKKCIAKEEEEKNYPSSDKENSSSFNTNKKNIRSFFCVK